MANSQHLVMLGRGVNVWNEWRKSENVTAPDLKYISLQGKDLQGIDLSGADLSESQLRGVDLATANLRGAFLTSVNLSGANLENASFFRTSLFGTDLSRARLCDAQIFNSQFNNATLFLANAAGANFTNTVFSETVLTKCNFRDALFAMTGFNNVDLSEAIGLESARHYFPSSIGLDTLYRSAGKIPEAFLRGCGTPEEFIRYFPSLVGAGQTIQFYSCFISYSTRDEEFARRLHSRMREVNLRVWFAPEDMKGGEKIFEQIESAIHLHDRLLLVLSESSLKSEWVFTEIRRSLKAEKRQNRRKLFPIRLTGYDRLKEWELIDTDSGKDLAAEIRSYFIPDFSNWKDHDAFEAAFVRLIRDLKAEEKQ